MTITTGTRPPDLTVPGICAHLPMAPAVSERLSISTSQDGTTNRAVLTIGRTLARGDVTLTGTDLDAEFFADLALHAARCASWLRGERPAAA